MNVSMFDQEIDRHMTGSYKWDDPADSADCIQLWVADMDFKAAPPIIDALRRRVDHGVFGYVRVPDDFYNAAIDWFRNRHGWEIDRESIVYTSGVVPAISAIIKAVTKPGDKVAVQTPVYNCFFSSIRNNGCIVADSPLKLVGGRYEIDFCDFERVLSDSRVKVFLLCNPHNPAGRVWTRDELSRIDMICRRHGVLVISDEIHCELTFPGYCYTPFAAVSPEAASNSVSCISPSKAFNIAGLQIADIVCVDEARRAAIDRAININEVCDVNPFGVVALIAAYRNGEKWLGELIEYIHGNYVELLHFFEENLSGLTVTAMEGTYLAWVDCRATRLTSDEIERMGRAHGVRVASGSIYGGEGFIRINMATPRNRLMEGLRRLARALNEG